MKKAFVSVFYFIAIFHSQSTAQTKTPDSIQARIILIGDAGELKKGRHPVISGVKSSIHMDKKTTVVYLGDNLYKTGLPDDIVPDYNFAKAPLDTQISIAKGTDAKVYFIPGNHDWNDTGPHGWETIQREQRYVEILGDKNIYFEPKDGCPGPVEVKITEDVTLIIMDSHWWIHPYDKPGIESDCPFKTKSEVLTQLDDLLSRNSKKLVLFAVHHPFRSNGIHGGHFTWKQHIFPLTEYFPKLYIPLPVIGSVYPITRGIFGTTNDLSHPAYADMINQVEGVLKGHDNVIHVAGHEHTLQLLKDTGRYYLVSGSGTKSNRVNKSKKALFVSEKNGFAVLDISKNKNVFASFYTVDTGGVKQAYDSLILNFTGLPPKPEDTLREVEVAFKDSVIVSASDQYKKATGFKNTFLGKNYREEWSVPIQLKVFNLKKEKGGFKIESLGGGKQTKSLRLTNLKTGREWTLRSVEKDPEKAIPENLRGSLAQDIVQDLISASHPYAPLVIPGLAKATGVPTPQPQFFFVPDDPAFTIYRKAFANRVAHLEEREPTPDNTGTKSTAKIINNLIEDHDDHVDQQAYLRARLLDNVIGDWDRHFDQWRWGTSDTGKGKLYYPVPRDRDMAFFNSDGLLLRYLSKNQFKYLQGFEKDFYSVKWFNWEARDLDRIFMNQLTENEWKNVIDTFQTKLTNTVIDSSVKKLPPEIYALDPATISDKLKSRRDLLMKEGMKYYSYISRRVNIVGSNKQELFKVENINDSIRVTVYKENKKNVNTGIMYQRSFTKYTKELRLFGLHGNDRFEIDEKVSGKTKVRLIGGKGNDTFDIRGNTRNYVYDITTSDTSMKVEQNHVENANKTKVRFSSNPLVNEYKPYGYTYNVYRFPQLNIGYNPEDKLLMGIGFSAKTHSFRKEPYSTFQRLSTLYAFNLKAYQLKYQGIFNNVIQGNKDILFNAEFVNPTLNNFFGFGNESPRDATKQPEFYRVRYKYFRTDLLIRKRFNDILEMSLGPSYYHYWNKLKDNKGRILEDPSIIGLDPASVYALKKYLGAKLKIDINYINSELLPTRGVTWYTELSSMYGLNDKSKDLARFTTDMTVYASLSLERKLVGIFRIGGGHIFSKDFEYFQALTLGANNYVRGFRKDRFAGSGIMYASAEGRVKLFKSESYILPGDVGIIGFYDVGKVWMRGMESKKWHSSYGGGLYYSPFNIVIVSATVGISDEDNLLNFSLGTKFRITF